MEKVAIIGVGQSAFVRGYPGSIRELAFEGFKEAVEDAKVSVGDINASVICSAPEYDKQRSVKSGLHDVVAVLGFQKMSEISSAESQERMGRGADIQWESPFGTMMPAYYAMFAKAHMEKYGTTLDDMALIRVKAACRTQVPNK